MLTEVKARNESSLESLFGSLFLASDWRDRVVMPLAAYFDASGHQEDQKYLVVAGFVAPPAQWIEFDGLWRARLEDDGIQYFHAVEFAHSTLQFAEGWKGNEPRRRALLSDLMDIVQGHVSRKFSDVVTNEALNDQMSEETKAQFHINAYSLAGRTCAARLREWLRLERWDTVPELIFEEGDIGAELLRATLLRDGFADPIFRPKKDRETQDGLIIRAPTPLQAADWLAYEIFLASKAGQDTRWPMQEFETIPGLGGIYTARDVERLEQVLNTPMDQILEAGLWDVHTLS